MNVDLGVDLCGVKMENPTMLASGIQGSNAGILRRNAGNGVGALITKSIGPEPRAGYPGPPILEPMDNVMLNAMGLPNPGYKYFIEEELSELKDLTVPVIPSIFGDTKEDFAMIAVAMEDAGLKLIEVNVSCPHKNPRNGKKELFGQNPELIAEVVQAIDDEIKIPFMVKLSPNVTDIGEIAIEAVRYGANALSAINTIEAFDIEPELERPYLGNLLGGQSGHAIMPIALRKVANIVNRLTDENKIVPVVGVGGISSGLDIVKFLLVGAHCIQIGTAAKDMSIFKKCVEELRQHLEKKGYKNLEEIRGNALKNWLHS